MPTERTLGLVAWLLLTALALPGCAVMSPDVNLAASFLARAEASDGRAWLDEQAPAYVAALSSADRQRIAEQAVLSADSAVRLFGLQLMYREGASHRATATAADLLLRGDDLTPLAWSWLHSGHTGLAEQRLGAIRAALVARKSSMTSEQLRRAEQLLCETGDRCLSDSTPESSPP